MKLERKLLPIADAAFKATSDAEFTFEGWASKFGGLDSYNDTIVAGAYKDTLAKNATLPVYFNHIYRRSDMGARVGTIRAEEKSEGLWVKGELLGEHPLVKNMWPSMKAGFLDGLSIGYSVPEGGAVMLPTGVRQLIKIDLGEISLVEEPADGQARVDLASVKAGSYTTPRDFEHLLREAGLSKTEALALVACAKGIFAPKTEASEADQILAALKNLYVKKA